MSSICVICLGKTIFCCDNMRRCAFVNCNNIICNKCTILTNKLRIVDIHYQYCSVNCLMHLGEYINHSFYDKNKVEIKADQIEIYEEIMSINRYNKLLDIGYINVLAKIISEY